jgi:hypothetical protein
VNDDGPCSISPWDADRSTHLAIDSCRSARGSYSAKVFCYGLAHKYCLLYSSYRYPAEDHGESLPTILTIYMYFRAIQSLNVNKVLQKCLAARMACIQDDSHQRVSRYPSPEHQINPLTDGFLAPIPNDQYTQLLK